MLKKTKAVTSIRIDADLFEEARRQKINVSLITEEAIKVAIGKPTMEFLLKQRQHHEEQISDLNKKMEELIREKKTQEEIAERKRKESEREQKLINEAEQLILIVKKELLSTETKQQISKIMEENIKKHENNPFVVLRLKEYKKTYESAFDQKRWDNYKRSFREELGLKEEEEENEK